MNEQVTVAAVAAAAQSGKVEENLAVLDAAVKMAAAAGAELVLFPELSATGFIPNHPTQDHAGWLREVLRQAWETAQPLDGAVVRGLIEIATSAGVFLSAGLLENAGNILHNTHVLVGDGKLWGYWRKMHIPIFEMPVYNGGEAVRVIETPLGRIGANVCFDVFLPESTRLLGVENAELVLFPFAADPPPLTPEGWFRWAQSPLQARCAENAVFGVACNYSGHVEFAGVHQRFAGGAAIVGPDGALLSSIEEEMVVHALKKETLLEARSRFEYTYRFRRPELYASLSR
ncbi:MAG: carbon-nitrogen hydrolase family protein [Bryobacterales bacterium]|nr:carbon-nitrogen hydrolase family protein [Bryobacterales bacterium]